MAEMGKYCKAYYAKDLRGFSAWEENLDNLRLEKNDKDEEIERTELKDDDILYVQENYTVTDGIFIDENIIFENVTDAWKEFCEKDLNFEIPVYEPIEIKTAEATESAEN